MNIISVGAATTDLASTLKKVCNDHAPVLIARDRNKSVVLISLGDYKVLEARCMPSADSSQEAQRTNKVETPRPKGN